MFGYQKFRDHPYEIESRKPNGRGKDYFGRKFQVYNLFHDHKSREEHAWEACLPGKYEIIKNILFQGSVDVNLIKEGYGSFLHKMVCGGKKNADIIQLLLTYGADVLQRETEPNGETSIHLACKDVDILKLLLVNNNYVIGNDEISKADILVELVNANSSFGTPLHRASWFGYADSVKYLLNCGADMTVTDKYGKTPLYVFIANEFYARGETERKDKDKTIHTLLQYGKVIDRIKEAESYRKYYSLFEAIYNYDLEKLEFLLDQVENLDFPNIVEESILFYALELTQPDTFRILINKGANVNICKSVSPLHVTAINLNLIEEMEIMIDLGADVNFIGSYNELVEVTPLFVATAFKHHEQMEILLRNQADPDKKCSYSFKHKSDLSPLHQATLNRDFKAIKVLIEYGADVNSKIASGRTPLHMATDRDSCNPKFVEFYLQHGADPNITDNQGQTSLHLACMSCHEGYQDKIIELLLRFGAKVDIKDRNEKLPLHYADNSTIVKLLLPRSIFFINIKDKDGNTPFHIISRSYNCKLMLRYLKLGADLTIENNDNQLPIIANSFCKRCLFFQYLKRLKMLGYDRPMEDKKKSNLKNSDHHVCLKEEGEELEEIRGINFPQKWEEEIVEMKSKVINARFHITLYDMLFMKRRSVSIYSESQIISNLYAKSDNNFENLYPNYGFVLNFQYRRSQRRRHLMRLAKKTLEDSTGMNIPNFCTEKIFCLINDWDLKILGEK